MRTASCPVRLHRRPLQGQQLLLRSHKLVRGHQFGVAASQKEKLPCLGEQRRRPRSPGAATTQRRVSALVAGGAPTLARSLVEEQQPHKLLLAAANTSTCTLAKGRSRKVSSRPFCLLPLVLMLRLIQALLALLPGRARRVAVPRTTEEKDHEWQEPEEVQRHDYLWRTRSGALL